MARWALALSRGDSCDPVVYVAARFIERHMLECKANGILVLSPEQVGPARPTATEQPNSRTRTRRILRRIPGVSRLARGWLRFQSLLSVRARSATLAREIEYIRQLVREQRIDVLLLAESSPDHGAAAYIEAGRREGIPVVTAPIEQGGAHHYAEGYLSAVSLSLARPINRIVAALYPHWVIAHKRHRLLRTEVPVLLALEWAGLAPPHPWQLVGNLEDMVAVDSEATFYFYMLEGVPAGQMTVVGRPEHDIMADVRNNRSLLRTSLDERLGLDPGRPLILSPLVQDHYLSGRPECDFQKYDEMADFWVRSLVETGWNVVLSLHPGHTFARDPRSWRYLEESGARIASDDIASLIPLCDIYAAAGSTTIQWAIACAKPVINYDIYRYGAPMAMYRGAPGVLSTQEKYGFTELLRRLTSDKEYHADIARRQSLCAEQWGVLDGRAAERLALLFRRLRGDRSGNPEALQD